MRLRGVELRLLDLELRAPIGTSAGTHRARPLVLLRVVTDEAEGWGECAALVDGTAVDPTLAAVWAVLVDQALPRLARATSARDGHLPEASRVAALFGGTPDARMAAAAVEMAVLDAELRVERRSLVDRLGALDSSAGLDGTAPRAGSVAAGALVGIPPDHRLSTLVGAVDHLVAEGFGRVRMKIGPDWDVAPVRAVRKAHPSLSLQADANGAYRLGDLGAAGAERLAELDPLDLGCIEQPLAPEDLVGHAALAERLATPLCLDESLSSVHRVRDALRYGACAVACLKPARLGGVFAAHMAQAACRAAGIGAFVGGFFESGLGRSVNAAVATLPGFSLPGDLSPPAQYLAGEPFGYPELVDGRIALYGGPGVAPTPDPAALARYSNPEYTLWVPYTASG